MEVRITLKKVVVIHFVAQDGKTGKTIQNAIPVVNDADKKEVSPNGDGSYVLYPGEVYTYSYFVPDYNSVTHDFVPDCDNTITVTLTSSAWGTDPDRFIYGDGNEGKVHVVTKGGTYSIGDGATGIMTINMKETVTLVGSGMVKQMVKR